MRYNFGKIKDNLEFGLFINGKWANKEIIIVLNIKIFNSLKLNKISYAWKVLKINIKLIETKQIIRTFQQILVK